MRSKGQRSAGQEPGSLARSPRPGPSPPKHDLGHGTKSAETTGVSRHRRHGTSCPSLSRTFCVVFLSEAALCNVSGGRVQLPTLSALVREPCHKHTHVDRVLTQLLVCRHHTFTFCLYRVSVEEIVLKCWQTIGSSPISKTDPDVWLAVG